jgi:Arc/MetJ family transcription regulator
MARATLEVDDELLRRASEVLGTPDLQATVEGALREVLAQEARRQAVEQLVQMSGLDLDQPEVMAAAWR